MKKCKRCGKTKELKEFVCVKGEYRNCLICHREYNKLHEKDTIDGFLMRVYHTMKNRINGVVEKNKAHLYEGLELLDKELFYDYSRGSREFLRLYKAWQMNGKPKDLKPALIRIDVRKGFTLDNIEWVPLKATYGARTVSNKFNNVESRMIYKILGVTGDKK